MTTTFKNHDLVEAATHRGLRIETFPVFDPSGEVVPGIHATRIALDNPEQLNSYTTEMVKGVILGMRAASNDRACAAVVFTGVGDRSFCTGGNTAEYAEYYAGRPEEYRQYMRLFNDMVTAILHCDKPVICRINGMRIAGGQEIGMACDFSIAQDLALIGQAGPKHGSAPDGGSTDFLPLFVGAEAAMISCTLCEHWSAHKAYRLGLLTDIVPALKIDGEFVSNPMVITERYTDEFGRIVHGEFKTGADRVAAKARLADGTIDLGRLDAAVDQLITKLLMTMPGCLSKTLESVRKHKLQLWDKNRETNRAWLGLNMMTEGRVGFRAFHEGSRECREPDFLLLRRRLAEGALWGDELIEEVLAKAHGKLEVQRG
jgi:6-oxo-cyclohex-1-ene-carbonyl-CoA hydrolase